MKSSDCPGLTVGSRLKPFIDVLLDDGWLDPHTANDDATDKLQSRAGLQQTSELSRSHVI